MSPARGLRGISRSLGQGASSERSKKPNQMYNVFGSAPLFHEAFTMAKRQSQAELAPAVVQNQAQSPSDCFAS